MSAQALVAELAPALVQVQAAVLELAQMRAQRLVQALARKLAHGVATGAGAAAGVVQRPPVVWVLKPRPLVRMQGRESARQLGGTGAEVQAQELQVSRQLGRLTPFASCAQNC